MPPRAPRLVMVIVEPLSSSSVILPSRAAVAESGDLSAHSHMSRASAL